MRESRTLPKEWKYVMVKHTVQVMGSLVGAVFPRNFCMEEDKSTCTIVLYKAGAASDTISWRKASSLTQTLISVQANHSLHMPSKLNARKLQILLLQSQVWPVQGMILALVVLKWMTEFKPIFKGRLAFSRTFVTWINKDIKWYEHKTQKL